MTLDLVSVIMPVFNAAPYVSEAIQSVLAQTYSNWELIIVNDGSTDESEKIIKGFSDPRIYSFSQSNQGVSAARNLGLREMRGEFFCFLDADDVLPENSINARLTVFRMAGQTQFVDGVVQQYNPSMSEITGSWSPSFKGQPRDQLLRLSSSCFYGSTWMIRRKIDQPYSFCTDVTNAEDLLFYLSIADQGTYTYTHEVILYNRRRTSSASTNLDGLGAGYLYFYNTAIRQVSWLQRWYLDYRVRRIMFLSYLSQRQVAKAIRFALLRKL